MVTKQHFELVARVIRDQKMDAYSEHLGAEYLRGYEKARLTIAHKLAREFGMENPRFNLDRFLRACGLHEGEVTDNG